MPRVLKWTLPPLALITLVAYVAVAYLIATSITQADRKDLFNTPADYGLSFQEIEFASRLGDVALRGWIIPAEGGLNAEGAQAVVLVHGINSTRTGGDGDITHLASMLVQHGYNVLLFDQRGHGTSDGDHISGGYFERLDVLGAVDALQDRGLALDSIGLLGFSMGAATALLAAADEPGIGALVVDSPYADVSDLIAQETARTTPVPEWAVPIFIPMTQLLASVLYNIDVSALAPENAVASLDYPILVIHSTADERIPTQHGIRVHAAAHPDSELWLVEGVAHVDAFDTYPEEYTERVIVYFAKQLQ
jgi:pimeloyl-ACP methyl ester carboxylesterase